MADGLFGTSFNPAGMIGFSMDTLLIIVMAVIGGVIIYFMYLYFSYKKTIIVKKIVDGRKIVMYDKAKLFKDKTGVQKYKFQKLKITAPIPPPKAIEITKGGKEFLECYLLETGEISWIIDINDTTPKTIIDGNGKEVMGNSINVLEPFTTNQRQMLEHEFYKAHLEKGKSWTEHLGQIVYVGALVIIVIALMVFYGDMGKPLLQMGGQLNQFQETQKELMVEQAEMMDKMNDLVYQLNQGMLIQQNNGGGSVTPPNRVVPN